jgi:hypothetical protein
MTATITEIEAIEAIDWEHEPACEFPLSAETKWGCPHAAEWRIVKACCRRTFLYCEDHLLSRFSQTSLLCVQCGTRFMPPSTAYSLIERI